MSSYIKAASAVTKGFLKAAIGLDGCLKAAIGLDGFLKAAIGLDGCLKAAIGLDGFLKAAGVVKYPIAQFPVAFRILFIRPLEAFGNPFLIGLAAF